MERLLPELSISEERVARHFASGLEKKEIAVLFYRAISTINNQLQAVFLKLDVRNGRELAIVIAERMTNKEIKKTITALSILCMFSIHGLCENQRRPGNSRSARTNTIARVRIRGRSEDIYYPLDI